MGVGAGVGVVGAGVGVAGSAVGAGVAVGDGVAAGAVVDAPDDVIAASGNVPAVRPQPHSATTHNRQIRNRIERGILHPSQCSAFFINALRMSYVRLASITPNPA